MMRFLLSCVLVAVMAGTGLLGQSWENPAFSERKSERFDFWVGEWDVNLRILQDDLTWKDSVKAEAHIFSILDGRAVLELWDSEPIVGYSLRYYDPAKDKWVLWLNWPGRNRAGSSSLEGSFRHGRGEFFITSKHANGEEVMSRYSFSDVSPTSLRWDDAFSKDGGRTWTHGWIMEFSRRAPRPDLPSEGGPAHTFREGQRCSRDEFRGYEGLSGRWEGKMALSGSESPLEGQGYRVLGGCAVLFFRQSQSGDRSLKSFGHLTYNTHADLFELTLMDNQGSTARLFYGERTEQGLDLKHTPVKDGSPTHRYVIQIDEAGDEVVEQLYVADATGQWGQRIEWRLKRQ